MKNRIPYLNVPKCPRCGSYDVTDTIDGFYICEDCNKVFYDPFLDPEED